VADEAKFIDLPASPLWLAHDHPQVNPTPGTLVARPRSTVVKLMFPLRAQQALGETAAQQYWLREHGPLIRSQAAGSGILRYLQVHRVEDELEQQLRQARGTKVDGYTGHAELWFDRATTAITTSERRDANARAVADESQFIDFAQSAMWLAKEHVVVDRL